MKTEAVEGYNGVYVEILSCGHMRYVNSWDETPRMGRRHCRDCRDFNDRCTLAVKRIIAKGRP